MSRHPLELQRFIGWISFALGASALQANDSVFYRMVYVTGLPLFWIGGFIVCGLLLISATYLHNVRLRIVMMILLFGYWITGLCLVIASGPLGAFGAVAIVVIVYLMRIIIMKLNDGDPITRLPASLDDTDGG